MRHAPSSTLLAWVVTVTACGDSLYGQGLVDYAPAYPTPDRPVLEVRWFGGFDAGFDAPCRVEPAIELNSLIGWDAGLGLVEAPMGAEPSVWNETSSWRFAMGQVLLVEGGGPGRRTSELFPTDGAWGLAQDRVLFVAQGDIDALQRDLGIEDNASGDGLVEGAQVLEHGNPRDARDWMTELSIPDRAGADPSTVLGISHLDLVFGAQREMAIGAGPGGITFEPCAP